MNNVERNRKGIISIDDFVYVDEKFRLRQNGGRWKESWTDGDVRGIESYFEYVVENDIIIEYVSEFDMFKHSFKPYWKSFKKGNYISFAKFRENIFDGGIYTFLKDDGKRHTQFGTKFTEGAYKYWNMHDASEFGHKDNFYYRKWMNQTLLEHGNSFPVNVIAIRPHKLTDDEWKLHISKFKYYIEGSEMEFFNKDEDMICYEIHPGKCRMGSMAFMNIRNAPFLIYYHKDDNLENEYGGVKIKSFDDFYNVVLKDIQKENVLDTKINLRYWKRPLLPNEKPIYPYALTDLVFITSFDKIVEERHDKFFVQKKNFHTLPDLFRSEWYEVEGNNRWDHHLSAYKYDPPVNYFSLLNRSLPFKIYVMGDNYQEYVDNFKKSTYNCKHWSWTKLSDIEKEKMFNKDYGDYVVFEELDKSFDIYNLPKKNFYTGLCLFVKTNIKLQIEWFEFLYFGHTERALSKIKNKDDLILFNCEHPFWEYNGKVDNLKVKDMGLLPEVYCE